MNNVVSSCKIASDVYYLGVDDRKNQLFENLWIIPDGISYNAYLIKDEKVALIEGGVKVEFERNFLRNLEMITDPSDLDYIVINHMEPDHTGTLPTLYRISKKAKIITTPIGRKMLYDFYGIKDESRIIIVKDKDTLSLGKKELEFYSTPGVHWPETMMTYEKTNKILFSGDAFGTYGALDGKLFDDEHDINTVLKEAKRYFVNIIGKYTAPTLNAIKKIKGLDIKIIAPAHGPIWRSNPRTIIEYYRDLAEVKVKENKATIVYGTMYGYIEDLIRTVSRRLENAGFEVHVHNVNKSHISQILADIWDSNLVVFGTPTYDAGPFPPVYYVAYLIARKNIQNKHFGIVGTSGWSGKGYKQLIDLLLGHNWKLIEPIVEIRGRMSDKEINKVQNFVNASRIELLS